MAAKLPPTPASTAAANATTAQANTGNLNNKAHDGMSDNDFDMSVPEGGLESDDE